MAKNIIADSGFWFALFNERDAYHEEALVLEEDLHVHKIVVPWPTLYETLNTRFLRRRHDVVKIKSFLENPSTVLLEDSIYREASLRFILNNQTDFTYSLVDLVIRSMIEDVTLSIDALISFNPRDFYDICDSRSIEMLYR